MCECVPKPVSLVFWCANQKFSILRATETTTEIYVDCCPVCRFHENHFLRSHLCTERHAQSPIRVKKKIRMILVEFDQYTLNHFRTHRVRVGRKSYYASSLASVHSGVVSHFEWLFTHRTCSVHCRNIIYGANVFVCIRVYGGRERERDRSTFTSSTLRVNKFIFQIASSSFSFLFFVPLFLYLYLSLSPSLSSFSCRFFFRWLCNFDICRCVCVCECVCVCVCLLILYDSSRSVFQ